MDIMSYDEGRYLDIDETKETPDIRLMNIGFTKADESANPTEKNTQYIGDKNKTNIVTGYDIAISVESDLISDDDVVQYLYDIYYRQKTSDDAKQYIYLVDLWRPVEGAENEYTARKIYTSFVFSDKPVAAGEQITFSGDFKGCGDIVYGTFNTSDKTFTEEA